MAQLVERGVNLERRWRVLREGGVSTLFVQMERRDDFRKWHVALAQQFAGSDRIDRVTIHISFEQVFCVSRKRVEEEVAKFRLGETSRVAKMKNIELIPMLHDVPQAFQD